MAMGTDTWAAVIRLGAPAMGPPTTAPAPPKCSASSPGPRHRPTAAWSIRQRTDPARRPSNGGDTLVWLTNLLGLPERDIGAARTTSPHRAIRRTCCSCPTCKASACPTGTPRCAVPSSACIAGMVQATSARRAGGHRVRQSHRAGARRVGNRPRRQRNPFRRWWFRHAAWCQIKSDICARPVTVVDTDEPGLTGAGLVAWAALDHATELTEQVSLPLRRTCQPRPLARRLRSSIRAIEQPRRSPRSHTPSCRRSADRWARYRGYAPHWRASPWWCSSSPSHQLREARTS